MSYKNWVFTLNTDVILQENDPIPELGLPAELEFGEPQHIVQAVYQLERSPQTGRLHYQGYVRLDIKCRLGRAKEIFGANTVHLENRKGTHVQAAEYASKEDTRVAGPWRIGVDPSNGGRRATLSEVTESLYAGSSLREIMRDKPDVYCQYRQGLRDIAGDSQRLLAREWRTLEVFVYHGDAGAGKTRRAVEESNGDYFILDHSERVWFDGYDGQKTLIIDDFYGWIKYHYLLRILDGYELRLEIKGGFTYALWTRVFITSNHHPDRWYPTLHPNGMSAALERRVKSIVHFAN